MCQKVFRRRMVLEGEEDNLVEVAVETLEREKEQIDNVLHNHICRLIHLSIVRLDFGQGAAISIPRAHKQNFHSNSLI